MKKAAFFTVLLACVFLLCGCKAEPLEGIISQPESEAPKRALYFCAPREVDSLYIDTYRLVEGQWVLSHSYGIAADESEMNEGVIHGTLKLSLQEDLSLNYEFSYAGLHYYNTGAFEADLKNTDAVFHKETQYDIITDTPIPVILITDGGMENITLADYGDPAKLAECKMAQAVVLTFSTEKLVQ